MNEEAARAVVVAEALSWVGTPFNHMSDRKGAGVDCAMLAVRSFVDSGILEPFDPRPYPRQWHMHRSEERFLNWITTLGKETEELLPANIVLFREGRCYSHCGIITLDGNLVHASWRAGRVMISPLFQSDLMFLPNGSPRPRLVFDVWR